MHLLTRKLLLLIFAASFMIALILILFHSQQNVQFSTSLQSWIGNSKELIQQSKLEVSMPNEFNSIQELYKCFHWSNSSACQFAVDFGFNIINYNGIAAPDGHKSVCLDASVAPIYGDCLVYSFGINNQWTFDDAMDQMHCQVYSFDPSMGVADHNRTDRIHFYSIGLSGEDRDDIVVKQKKWKMRTLKVTK